jgi:hypothetical protein
MCYWIQVVWNSIPRVLLRIQGIPVLNAFGGHLTLNVRSIIHAINTAPCGHIWTDDFATTFASE